MAYKSITQTLQKVFDDDVLLRFYIIEHKPITNLQPTTIFFANCQWLFFGIYGFFIALFIRERQGMRQDEMGEQETGKDHEPKRYCTIPLDHWHQQGRQSHLHCCLFVGLWLLCCILLFVGIFHYECCIVRCHINITV